MVGQDNTEQFVQELIGCQTRLLAYITMLLADPLAASDVLQETNLVLWRKAAEYLPDRDFGVWACGIARFQVLAFLRDARRDRHCFDESLLEKLAEDASLVASGLEARHLALDKCLEKLTPLQRELLQGRYTRDESIAQLAKRIGRSAGGIAMALSRIRQSLLDCIERHVYTERNA